MKNLKVTTLQSKLHWENPVKNLKMFTSELNTIAKGSTDIIILPEMFSTGFTMKAEMLAESMEGLSMQWMSEMASSLKSVICGSLIIQEKNKYYNRFIWMQPDRNYVHYDKRHLFRMAGENEIYSAGKQKVIIPYKGWRICPQVCYDLRFPVFSRNRAEKRSMIYNYEYDLLIYVANWPSVRRNAWNQLLIARAIENQCYVAGVNRTGKDDKGNIYSGGTAVLDFMGYPLHKTVRDIKSTETISLSLSELKEYRKKFPVLADADKFELQ